MVLLPAVRARMYFLRHNDRARPILQRLRDSFVCREDAHYHANCDSAFMTGCLVGGRWDCVGGRSRWLCRDEWTCLHHKITRRCARICAFLDSSWDQAMRDWTAIP